MHLQRLLTEKPKIADKWREIEEFIHNWIREHGNEFAFFDLAKLAPFLMAQLYPIRVAQLAPFYPFLHLRALCNHSLL